MANKPETIHVSNPKSDRDTGDNGQSYILPAETRVYLSAPGVHFNPRYWPDPYKLDPQRWMATEEEKRDKHMVAADRTRHMRGSLLTFSDGARACLGRKFAQAEYIAFFATLLKTYRVVLEKGQDPAKVERDLFMKSAGKITLAPLDKVQLKLEKR
jgi:cytochrome P450